MDGVARQYWNMYLNHINRQPSSLSAAMSRRWQFFGVGMFVERMSTTEILKDDNTSGAPSPRDSSKSCPIKRSQFRYHLHDHLQLLRSSGLGRGHQV